MKTQELIEYHNSLENYLYKQEQQKWKKDKELLKTENFYKFRKIELDNLEKEINEKIISYENDKTDFLNYIDKIEYNNKKKEIVLNAKINQTDKIINEFDNKTDLKKIKLFENNNIETDICEILNENI